MGMTDKASNARKTTQTSEAIAAQVRAERAAIQMDKDEMIRRTRIGRGTYFDLEAGRKPFDVSQLSIVCEVLGISLSELLARAEHRIEGPSSDVTENTRRRA